jgi:hypothetical protein
MSYRNDCSEASLFFMSPWMGFEFRSETDLRRGRTPRAGGNRREATWGSQLGKNALLATPLTEPDRSATP